MRLFCKLSSLGSSDPYHFGGTRSVLSWETIVHYPQYKLRGQIRLKDTTLSLGSDLLLNNLFALQVFFLYVFSFWSFKRTRELHLLPYWIELIFFPLFYFYLQFTSVLACVLNIFHCLNLLKFRRELNEFLDLGSIGNLE